MKSFLVVSLVVSGVALVYVSAGPMGGQESQMKVKSDGGPLEDIRMKLYEVYMKLHNKTYVREELPRRLENFWRRREMALESIKNFTEGRSKWTMSENNFMDLDDEELKKMHGSSPRSQEEMDKHCEESEAEDSSSQLDGAEEPAFASEVDWRTSGCINSPMDQGQCGSCYAAAARGLVEDTRCVYLGSSPRLSHQQVVDCVSHEAGWKSSGCESGFPDEALEFWSKANEIALADCYPKTERQDQCYTDSLSQDCFISASPTGSQSLKYKWLKGEQKMMNWISQRGPVLAFIEMTDRFQMYGNGIFMGEDCTNEWMKTNHNVVILGYGTEDGVPYWLIKNSYNTWWGLGGFAKLRRGACADSFYGLAITA